MVVMVVTTMVGSPLVVITMVGSPTVVSYYGR